MNLSFVKKIGLILTIVGIGFFVGVVVWKARVEGSQQRELADMQRETEVQLQELEILLNRVRSTRDHGQICWRAKELLGEASAEAERWKARWEQGGRREGAYEQRMWQEALRRRDGVNGFMAP